MNLSKLLVALVLVAGTLNAADPRTRVIRHPNGASGAITNITATAYWYEIVGTGRRYMYRATWTEAKTTGALVGTRTVESATYPDGTWSAPVTASESTNWPNFYRPMFNASCAAEDPNNSSGWNTTPGFLVGSAWNFAPPNDTLDYIKSTFVTDPENPQPDNFEAASNPVAYWPFYYSPDFVAGTGIVTTRSINWPTTPGVVMNFDRGVKAFVRLEKIITGARMINLVWDESLNGDTILRSRLLFQINGNQPWLGATASSGTVANGRIANAGFAQASVSMFGNQVTSSIGATSGNMYDAASSSGISPTQICAEAPAGGYKSTNAGSTGAIVYTTVIERFLDAYHRDHAGTSGQNPVAEAFADTTSALRYWPAAPEGPTTTAPYQFSDNVPLFDKSQDSSGSGVSGSGSGTGSGGGSGTYTGPPASAFPESGLPEDAGTSAPSSGLSSATVNNASSKFGLAITDLSSFSPTAQAPVTIAFEIPWTGGETRTFAVTSVPSTDTPAGAALNTLRILLRTTLCVCIVWKLVSRVYTDCVMY